MYLYTTCKTCSARNTIKSNATTRPDLERDKGETFKVSCKDCAIDQATHVNDVKADMSSFPLVLGLIFGVLMTALLFIVGWIAMVTIAIPMYIWRQQQNDVHLFNSYRL
jgi:hypothetical protein